MFKEYGTYPRAFKNPPVRAHSLDSQKKLALLLLQEIDTLADLSQSHAAGEKTTVHLRGDTVDTELRIGSTFRERVRRFEIALICDALRECQGNQARAAKILAIKTSTLHSKIHRYKIRFTPNSRGGRAFTDESQTSPS